MSKHLAVGLCPCPACLVLLQLRPFDGLLQSSSLLLLSVPALQLRDVVQPVDDMFALLQYQLDLATRLAIEGSE